MENEYYTKTIKKLKVLEKLLKKEYITIRKDIGDAEVVAEINNDVRAFLSAQLELILNPSAVNVFNDTSASVSVFTPQETDILKQIAQAALTGPGEAPSPEPTVEPAIEAPVEVESPPVVPQVVNVTPSVPRPAKNYGVVMPEGVEKAPAPVAPPKARRPNHLKNVPEGETVVPTPPPVSAPVGITPNKASPVVDAFKGWNVDPLNPSLPIKDRIAAMKQIEKSKKGGK